MFPNDEIAKLPQAGGRDVQVAFLLPYYPKKSGAQDDNSRRLLQLKEGDVAAIKYFADLLVKALGQRVQKASFIAIPSHTVGPANLKGGIRQLIARVGGIDHSDAFVRAVAVTKSATADSGKRPTAEEHYNSFRVADARAITGKSIILLDDVVTRCATMTGAYKKLMEASAKSVSCLALTRTSYPDTPLTDLLDGIPF